jgi:gliding motility-associated lipoprotein GldH
LQYYGLAGILFLSILIGSCTHNPVFDEVTELPSEGWMVRDTLEFNIAISDTAAEYDVFIHVRNEKTYSYSNLWLFIQTTAPNGQTLSDTLEILLADEQGNWLGKGIGNINTLLSPYLNRVSFRYRGIYLFRIVQGMRDEQLKGILDIGLRVDQHE